MATILLLFFLVSAFANYAGDNVKCDDEENKKRKQQNFTTRENRRKTGKRQRGTTTKKGKLIKKSKLKSDTVVCDDITDCKDSAGVLSETENSGFTKLTGTKHKAFNCYLCEDIYSTKSALNRHLETRHDIKQDERISDAGSKKVIIGHLRVTLVMAFATKFWEVAGIYELSFCSKMNAV